MNTETLPDEEFGRFFLQHRHKLVNAIAAWTGDRGGAEELAQDVMLTLAHYWGRYEKPHILMYRMAKQRLGRQKVIPAQFEPIEARMVEVNAKISAAGADTESENQSLSGEIMRALRTLPTRQREVIVLQVCCDMSQEEVAEILGITPSAVKTHKARGLRRLEEIIASRFPAGGAGTEQPVGGVQT